MMYRHLLLACILLLTALISFAQKATFPLGKNISRQVIIDTYLKDKPLDPIEGIWSEVIDSLYEFAIIKNTSKAYDGFDYLGIITDSRNKKFSVGLTKCLIKKSTSENIFTAVWFMGDLSAQGTTFMVTEGKSIEFYLPDGYGGKQKAMLIRVYPADANEKQPQTSSGTGFYISDDIIVTNQHVIDEAKTITVVFSDGTQSTGGHVVVSDPFNDLAMVRCVRIDPIKISLPIGVIPDIKEGEKVYTIGFPLPDELGSKAKISEGIINSITGMKDDPRMVQISIPTQPGNSGGPLINAHGQAIGVVTSGLNELYMLLYKGTISQNVNFAMKINYIDNLRYVQPIPPAISTITADEKMDADAIMTYARPAIVQLIVNR